MNIDSSTMSVSLFMGLYNALWRLCLPIIRRHPRLRDTADARLHPSHYHEADIWIQAASAGEAKLAAVILRELRIPQGLRILITTFTSQGRQLLDNTKTCSPNVHLNWFPFDCPDSISRILDKISPCCMVLLETELWPGLLAALKKKQIPVLVINARMSRKSFQKYRTTRILWSKLCPNQILAVSPLDAARFQHIFPESRVEIMSNIKFSCISSDQRQQRSNETSRAEGLLNLYLAREMKLTVFASIRRQEESMVIQMIQDLLRQYPSQALALFPRHMHRINAWKKRLRQKKISFCLRSELEQKKRVWMPPGQVILWDKFGEMNTIFPRAQAVFVGGSLHPLGGQNFLEPVLAGTPTVTGPYIDDFSWVGEEIFSSNIVQKAHSPKQAVSLLRTILESDPQTCQIRQKAQEYVAHAQDGVKTACEAILETIAH